MPSISATAILIALSFTTSSLAAPTARSNIIPVDGAIVKNSYIVKLFDTANKEAVISNLQHRLDSQFDLVHDYESTFFNAFSAVFDSNIIDELADNEHVEYISQDAIVRSTGTQTNAPWGLQRISRKGSLAPGSNPNQQVYRYDYPDNAGKGVRVYIVDTGINVAHVNFRGRASFGYSALSATVDGNGHGTHCAGTAVGSLYGVARSAEVVSVKVLADDGSGSTSDIIAGMNWVVSQYRNNRIPAVMSMSLGGAGNTALDHAVMAAINAGVHTVVAAGNNNADASAYSPARVPNAITVGATTIADVRASFSNYGRAVDIWAPGQNIISSWVGSTTATKNISGTSMATPHVAGILAALISQYGNRSPVDLNNLLMKTADRTSGGLLISQLSKSGASQSGPDGPDGLIDLPVRA